MKKRLRKKLRLAEFQELGFRVAVTLKDAVSESDFESFLGRFLDGAIEAHGLECGGGGGPKLWDVFTQPVGHRGSATEEHRAGVTAWCNQEDLITRFYVGPFVDSWYGEFDESMLGEWTEK